MICSPTKKGTEFIPREACGQEAWDDLVDRSPDGWVFSLYDWQDLILGVPRWQLQEESFAVLQDGRVVAVVPLQYIASLRQLASTGFSGSGVVLARDLTPKRGQLLLAAIYDQIHARAADLGAEELSIQICSVTERSLMLNWGVSPLAYFGFNDVSTLTTVVDLQEPEESLWGGLSQTSRHAIKRARDSGYTVETVNWLDHLDEYFRLHCATYERTGAHHHPREYFEGIARLMGPRGSNVLFAGISREGQAVAYHNCARHRVGALYHTACSASDHLNSGINYLLMWESLLNAKRAGFLFFEIGEFFPSAVSNKEASLSVFKRKFGGEAHRYFKGEYLYRRQESTVVREISEQDKIGIGPERHGLTARLGSIIRWLDK